MLLQNKIRRRIFFVIFYTKDVMIKKHALFLFTLACLLLSPHFTNFVEDHQLDAQSTLSYGTLGTSITTSSTGASTGTAFAVPSSYAAIITWQVFANGSALSVNLEGSNDNSAWSVIDTQTTAAGGLKNFGFTAVKFVRCSQVSRTGGTSTICTIVINRGFINGGNLTLDRMLVGDGTAAAPAYSFLSEPTTGIVKNSAVGWFQFSNNGLTRHLFGNAEYRASSGLTIGWSSNVDPTVSGSDTMMRREGPGAVSISNASNTNGSLRLYTTIFSSLASLANGTICFCSDCTIANPCASGGTGAIAKRLNGVWVCN